MTPSAIRACVRCHSKKVRCSGYPGCRSCHDASVDCQPYTRRKKADTVLALREAEERVRWLENELRQHFGIDCTHLPTGTSLPNHLQDIDSGFTRASHHQTSATSITDPGSSISTTNQPQNTTEGDTPDISLVTLNATGEQKYLGPSSGAFFARHAAEILRSYNKPHETSRRTRSTRQNRRARSHGLHEDPAQRLLSPDMAKLLYQSYVMWIHPLYLVFSLDRLNGLVNECVDLQGASQADLARSPGRAGNMCIFYLVMALGATNNGNTAKRLQQDSTSRSSEEAESHHNLGSVPSAASLYSQALPYFDLIAKDLHPSLTTIQILLLACVYSSYGPIESSQWQLAGLAMRLAVEIGLHYASRGPSMSPEAADERNCVFWTAFAIEISLCYNLGRPPSIGEEHITAELPIHKPNASFGILHIKHRQIQSRIISQVYGGAIRTGAISAEARQQVISQLQTQLDGWRDMMVDTCPLDSDHPYPFTYWNRLYHGTTFVLHRTSPLCSTPSPESLETCLRSSGAYIDSVADVLRTSNVPLSWMLVQGVVFAGLTMVITARTSFATLVPRTGLPFLLADLPAWMRKCSVCLAIMNERVSDDLLSRLDTDFDVLSDTTMRIISAGLTGDTTAPETEMDTVGSGSMQMPVSFGEPQQTAAWMPSAGADGWDDMGHFLEILGMTDSQTYWDLFPQDLTMSDGTIPWDTNT